MEPRRFFLFFVLSMGIWLGWLHLVVPVLFPNMLKRPDPAAKIASQPAKADDGAPADALYPVNEFVAPTEDPRKQVVADQPKHPRKTVVLGPADPNEGKPATSGVEFEDYLLSASMSSEGAAIDFVELTDKQRYPAFNNRGKRARVLGAGPKTPLKTFTINSREIDDQLTEASLDHVPWEIVPQADDKAVDHAVTFRFVSPDGRWELTKHFELQPVTAEAQKNRDFENTFVPAYEVKLKLTIRNLSDQNQQISYSLQGPVGVPLEDPENSYKYRDIRMGFLRDDGVTVDENKLSAAEAVKKAKNDKVEIWRRKIKYIGVDVLYFASLIMPGADQVESAKPMVVNENLQNSSYSDVSMQLNSSVLKIPAGGEVSHEYTLFAGPKRKELIGQLGALAVMDFGWFDAICRGMIWLLNTFHGLGLSYGIAIICLTALVRTLLLPISKHQAANAAKMKVLQPKIMAKQKELEAKYGKNTEEYMKAAQELSKEQLGMMMSGCLPVFLQLPIFIALYRAIGSSIELRMEPFLWFENLASPDALFHLPFVVPWFGWTDFNLLPCISTGLMYMHQKVTMPPPTNEEQAQQQKMMNFMMIFMGAMFFRVPSGLCLYFIATNVWSMTERWLFEHWKKKAANTVDGDTDAPGATSSGAVANLGPSSPSTQSSGKSGSATALADEPKPTALGGIWNRLQEAADNQRSATRQLDNTGNNRDSKKKKKR